MSQGADRGHRPHHPHHVSAPKHAFGMLPVLAPECGTHLSRLCLSHVQVYQLQQDSKQQLQQLMEAYTRELEAMHEQACAGWGGGCTCKDAHNRQAGWVPRAGWPGCVWRGLGQTAQAPRPWPDGALFPPPDPHLLWYRWRVWRPSSDGRTRRNSSSRSARRTSCGRAGQRWRPRCPLQPSRGWAGAAFKGGRPG